MPIFLVPTYKCPFCKVLAHKEIEKEEDVIYCPYCDVPMEVRDVNENVLKDSREEEVKSVCFDDCLKDDSGSSDIEENISDFVILSDSEDESNESGNRLRTLYARMADMSLEEIIRTESELVGEEVVDSDMSVAGPSSKSTTMSAFMPLKNHAFRKYPQVLDDDTDWSTSDCDQFAQ
ncbi:hypothetical protein NQ317_012767 [Molorchus minor]|uniref:Uncharacterized protein n=1 Tax=Molorchus minor TaxID=1323400 RepID=A0ABQ9K6E2_9CUCU|nr:hypothetical protein NQ317_012767 [Molorchus minor]